MFCKNCGRKLGIDDKFCATCGEKITIETAELPESKVQEEPLFFREPREEKKPRRVVHLEEFNWDLEGYPTTPKKTEAVDFDWASVLENNMRKAAPVVEEKQEEEASLDEMPKTVEALLEQLPKEVLEVSEEPETEPVEEEILEEPEQQAEGTSLEESGQAEAKSLEDIIDDFGPQAIEEPTRLIDKAQMKADSVDKFYVFSKKQEEYQNLLDREYEKLQKGLKEDPCEEEEGPVEETTLPEEILKPEEEESVEPTELDAAEVEPAAENSRNPELVAIVWSMPPAGILIEETPVPADDKEEEPQEPPVKKRMAAATIKVTNFPIEPQAVEEMADEKESETEVENASSQEEETPVVEEDAIITFADIFKDDEDDLEVKKGGGCLRAIAVFLVILVIIELVIIGIQYKAPDSKAAQAINDVYRSTIGLFLGSDEDTEADETPAEETETLSTLLEEQKDLNENIENITLNEKLAFKEGESYGFEEIPETYTFKDGLWYETEDGEEVTYGDCIFATLIQYYSALPDKINGVNNTVLDYVDDTSELYEELEGMEGDETRGYSINLLEIGEIRTGPKGFYVMVGVTSADKLQPEETEQTQIVYLEAKPKDNMMNIKATKNI